MCVQPNGKLRWNIGTLTVGWPRVLLLDIVGVLIIGRAGCANYW